MRKLISVASVVSFMRLVVLLLLTLVLSNVSAQQPSNVRVVQLTELQQLMKSKETEVKVFNFWATWCAPCIKELPLFEQLSQQKGNHAVYLVNLDLDLDPDPEKVYRFVDHRKIQSPVLMLNEGDPNSWIDKIDERWSGALPATMITNTVTGKTIFVESALHEGDLQELITSVQ